MSYTGYNTAAGLGGGDIAWAAALKPQYQIEAEKTTRIFVVIYPSERGRIFGPGGDDKYPRDLSKDDIGSSLGYGIYIEPANGAGKKLFGSSTKVEPTLMTLEEEENDSASLAVHTRTGHGVGTNGMLVRFLIAQHDKAAPVPRMVNLVQAIMTDVLSSHKNAGESAIREILEQLQGVNLVNKWSLEEFLSTADMVVQNQREEGIRRFSTTTVNYVAAVKGQ